LAAIGWGYDAQISPSLGTQQTQRVTHWTTRVPASRHVNPWNGLSRMHERDRRQTDHATEKCVGIGGIACTARAIPPNNAVPHTLTSVHNITSDVVESTSFDSNEFIEFP